MASAALEDFTKLLTEQVLPLLATNASASSTQVLESVKTALAPASDLAAVRRTLGLDADDRAADEPPLAPCSPRLTAALDAFVKTDDSAGSARERAASRLTKAGHGSWQGLLSASRRSLVVDEDGRLLGFGEPAVARKLSVHFAFPKSCDTE